MRKRITLTVTNDLSMDQRVHRIAATLQQAGWEVKVVGRLLPNSGKLEGRPYQTHRMKLRVLKGKWFYFWINFRLFFFLLNNPADVVYANDLDTLPAAWLAARLRGRKLVYDTHEWWTEIPELVTRPKTRAVWLWLERRLFHKADVVLTVNPTLAGIYQDLYKMPVAYLRNVPMKAENILERSAPGKLIWYQGALNEGRGLELMIAAMAHLPESYTLGIAGDGPIRGELIRLINQHGLSARVNLHGLVPFEQLSNLTKEASLGLSLEESYSRSYQVATPNKVYDYIQAGVPVLAAGLSEMRKIIEEFSVGEILDEAERNPSALAKRILGMIEDESKWREYHQCCLQAAEKLNWEKESARLFEILKPVS